MEREIALEFKNEIFDTAEHLARKYGIGIRQVLTGEVDEELKQKLQEDKDKELTWIIETMAKKHNIPETDIYKEFESLQKVFTAVVSKYSVIEG